MRDLIAALAAVEEAIRGTPAWPDGGAGPTANLGLNPTFLELVDRERRIIAALRSRRIPRYGRVDLVDRDAPTIIPSSP